MSEAGGSRDGVDDANNDDRPPPAKKAKLILSVVHEEFNVHQVWHSKKKQYVEGRRCKRCSHNFVSSTSANLKSHLKSKSHILLFNSITMLPTTPYTYSTTSTFPYMSFTMPTIPYTYSTSSIISYTPFIMSIIPYTSFTTSTILSTSFTTSTTPSTSTMYTSISSSPKTHYSQLILTYFCRFSS